MSTFTSETQVVVHSFTRQAEGGEVVVGRPEIGVFLAMPYDAIKLLDWLAEGNTVGEAQELYRTHYGEIPDLPGLLDYLEKKGFVGLKGNPTVSRSGLPTMLRSHFQWIPQSVAQAIFSWPVFAACFGLVTLAAVAIALEPGLVPGRNALYFQEHRFFYAVTLMIIGCLAVFIHEMAHLVAARALGVNSRLTISHRLWVIVAETDLTGLWSVPKRKRYLPILAGPIADLASAAVLVLLLFARERAWLSLGPVTMRIVSAVLFGYLMRLLWQFFFFVRTDVYYLVTTFFDCKNLLKDTEAFLRRQVARVLPRVSYEDQSGIPEAERRVICAYSLVWLLGRGVAFSVLFLVTLPLTFKYLIGIHSTLGQGFDVHPYNVLDSIAFAVLSLAPLFAGLWLWLRSLVRNWTAKV